jgi:hypothetical protein
MRNSAGLSAMKLIDARDALNPDPVEDHGTGDVEAINIQFRRMLAYPLTTTLFGRVALDASDRRSLEERVSALKGEARHLHEEVLLRLRTTRSHRTLVDRFKLRCESYDRARLRTLAARKSNPENRLVEEVARYLFDAGLDPLIGPLTGGVRPDAFDPRRSFYLEAKQYKSKSTARKAVRDGIRQVWDTAAILKSWGIREAFFIIFRRGGPHCALPECRRADGLTVYPVIVSIAPRDEIGSRAKERPIAFSEENLAPVEPKTDRARTARRAKTKTGLRTRETRS